MVEHDVDIDKLFEEGEEAALEAYVRLLHPADIAELFHFVEVNDWTKVTRYLGAERLAELLTALDESQRELLGAALRPERLVEAVDELETDDAADVIADLPDEKSAVVLEEIEYREEVEALLGYPDDSAGGIMQTELARVHEDAIVADAIAAVRKLRDEVEDVLELYVVADHERLCGTVALEDLVLSEPETPIREIYEPVEAKVTPEVDQEEVAEIFGKYNLYTLPVVDAHGALLGRITFDDVQDVIEEEASEDIMAAVGASAEDLVYSGDVLRIAMFRAPWLITTLLGSMVAGFLMTKLRALPGDALLTASFVPVVMAMTGNIGSQSAMIVTRGLAIGKVELANVGRVFSRELSVGLLIAVPAATVAGLIGHFWLARPMIGLTVGVSMSASMSFAALIGVAAPSLFKKLGIDPAIASGPLVTAGCDLLGASTYLFVALQMLT